MGSDNKPIHIIFDKGMDQSLDEFAVPVPGNIRHAINTRTRRGGSIEQRRGVHGFAVTTPSYMAHFQATGAVEFVGRIGNAPAFGMAGKAYVHDRRSQFAYFAGEYSQYEPLSRTTAILTERQHGIYGNRHVAIGRDLLGRKYTAIASMSSTNVECRVMNESGHTVASFVVEGPFLDGNVPDSAAIELFASDRSPTIYLAVNVNEASHLYEVHLAENVHVTSNRVQLGNNRTFAAHPVPTGAFQSASASGVDWAYSDTSSPGSLRIGFRNGPASVGDTVLYPLPPGLFAPTRHGVNFAVGKSPASHTVAAFTTGGPSGAAVGPLLFVATTQTTTTFPVVTATGMLLPTGAAGFSAPIVAPTDNPQRFLWAASNGVTTFGELVIPSGPPRVKTLGTMMGTPLSLMDSNGSLWMMTDTEGFAPVPRGGRGVLVSHPGAVPSAAAYAKPLVQLSAERQFPNPSDGTFSWREVQTQYSRIAQDGDLHSVLLPLQLRSQASGLFSLERYTYRCTTSSDKSRQTVPLKGTTLVAGQPGEFYSSPNRVGIGVITGAPTFAARPQLASEVGFAAEPYIATLAQASGSRIAPGTRLYSAIFEWLAPSGERHRSRPATPRSFVNATPAGVMPYVPEEFLSQRFPSPRVHYYRTLDGRKEFRRISPDTGVEPGTTFYDHNSDDEIRDNEILYTDGGVQPNDLAPSCRFMALSEDRLWVGGLFESDIIQASKKFVPREPVRFSDHDAFKVRLPFAATGLAYLDGAVVAFCEDSCYIITGDGPNDQGAGGFTRRPIADVGCQDHRSILVTSIGVFFQSKRSLQLMPRGFGPPEQIRNLNELMGEFGGGFTEVLGAALQEYSDEETARFLLRNPATDQRIVAVFELGTKTWSYDRISTVGAGTDEVQSLLTAASGVLLVDFFRADGFVVSGSAVQSVTNLMTGTVIANGGSAPVLTAQALGDKPGAVFDGVDDHFMTTEAAVVAALTSNAEFTAFLYAKYTAASSVTTILGAGRSDTATSSTVRLGNGQNVHRHITRSDAAVLAEAVFAEATDTQPHLLTFRHTATGTRLWIDGVQSTTGEAALAVGTLTPTRVAIGSRPDSVPDFFFEGTLGLVALVPSALADATRQAIEAAILAKATGNLGVSVPLSAIGDGPEGVLYGAGSGTYRILTELEGVGGTPYDSMGSTIDRFWSEVRLGRFQAFGPAGEGKLKAMQLRGYSPATGAQVNLSVVSDYGTLTHTYSGIGSGTFFRRSAAGPFDASASEAQVSAVFRTGVGQKHGLRLLSLTLELEPTQGLRRARIGEQD